MVGDSENPEIELPPVPFKDYKWLKDRSDTDYKWLRERLERTEIDRDRCHKDYQWLEARCQALESDRDHWRRRAEIEPRFPQFFEEFRLDAKTNVNTPEGYWTNFLGLRVRCDMFPNAGRLSGRYISDLPYSGDGVYGPEAEYSTMLYAIKAKKNRARYSAIELGAAFGPWISAAGVVCKRLGFGRIDLVGVEGDPAKADLMAEHLSNNGLSEGTVNSKVLRGAAWHEDGAVYFPKVEIHDYGGAATSVKSEIDHRGVPADVQAVRAYSLETVCEGLETIDYAHWDVAGAEWEIALKSKRLLNERFRYLFIGTHNRKIEGDLLELFHGMHWNLLRHDPCVYKYDASKSNLTAMTQNDGCMFFENPAIQ
jgi:hypothetical protein